MCYLLSSAVFYVDRLLKFRNFRNERESRFFRKSKKRERSLSDFDFLLSLVHRFAAAFKVTAVMSFRRLALVDVRAVALRFYLEFQSAGITYIKFTFFHFVTACHGKIPPVVFIYEYLSIYSYVHI